jgi:hypothetical protein
VIDANRASVGAPVGTSLAAMNEAYASRCTGGAAASSAQGARATFAVAEVGMLLAGGSGAEEARAVAAAQVSYLPSISPLSPLYLPSISPHFHCISPAPPLHLPRWARSTWAACRWLRPFRPTGCSAPL